MRLTDVVEERAALLAIRAGPRLDPVLAWDGCAKESRWMREGRDKDRMACREGRGRGDDDDEGRRESCQLRAVAVGSLAHCTKQV